MGGTRPREWIPYSIVCEVYQLQYAYMAVFFTRISFLLFYILFLLYYTSSPFVLHIFIFRHWQVNAILWNEREL